MYSTSRITECPHCNTAFRVSEAHLRAAKGAVRCGSCLEIFLAHQHWVQDDQFDDFDDWQDEDPNTMLAELEQLDRELEHSLAQDDWALQLLDDDSDHTPSPLHQSKATDAAPTFVVLDDEQAHITNHDTSAPLSNALIPDTETPRVDTLFATDALATQPTDDQLLADQPITTQTSATLESDDDNPFLPPPRQSSTSWIDWASLVVIILAALTLATQYLYFNATTLSRTLEWRPLTEMACPLLKCTVAEWEDLSAIHSEIVVRDHAEEKNALSVYLRLQNNSPLPQAFPHITLRFTDINGRNMGSRSFAPAEYLSGEIAQLTSMPVQQAIQIELAIVDPGIQALNYAVTLHK